MEEERQLVAALRAGDEAAFKQLIERYNASFVRVAQAYVTTRALAEEVAQRLDTINYEITCGLSARVRREHVP